VEREEGGRRRGTWAGAAGRRVAEDGRGRRGVGTSEEEEALARRLLQGPEEALARRREEERRGAGGARSADPVRGARGRRRRRGEEGVGLWEWSREARTERGAGVREVAARFWLAGFIRHQVK